MSFGSLTRKPVSHRALSLFCLVPLLLLNALAASPALHHCLHPDADQPDHHCAVTLLSAGKLDLASAPLVVHSLGLGWVTGDFLPPSATFVPFAYRLLPGRAPPALPA